MHYPFSSCRQQCAHTCICILSKKVHTLPYIPICRQQSGKEGKMQFCRQANSCKPIAGCMDSALALLLLFHYTHTVHTICRPYTPLPRPGLACRLHSPAVVLIKTKKDVKKEEFVNSAHEKRDKNG